MVNTDHCFVQFTCGNGCFAKTEAWNEILLEMDANILKPVFQFTHLIITWHG